MKPGEFMGLFFRTAPGLMSAVFGGACGAAVAFAGASAFLAVATGIAAFGIAVGALLASGLASKAAVAERDRRIASRNAASLARMEADRARLASVRVADREVADALAYALLEAGEFAQSCKRTGRWDPRAAHLLSECEDLVDVALREKDDAAKERRFGVEDLDPVENASARAAAQLRDRGRTLKELALEVSGGIDRGDRLEIREEMR